MSEVCGGITAPSALKDRMKKVSSALTPDSRTRQGHRALNRGVLKSIGLCVFEVIALIARFQDSCSSSVRGSCFRLHLVVASRLPDFHGCPVASEAFVARPPGYTPVWLQPTCRLSGIGS